MVRYLFGELSEEKHTKVEKRFLTDNRYFERLCSVEDALIDDYVQGTLSDKACKKIEGFLFCSPCLALEIDFVRGLIRCLSKKD
jgi:hypothetical protein